MIRDLGDAGVVATTMEEDIAQSRTVSDAGLAWALLERVHQENPTKGEKAAMLIASVMAMVFEMPLEDRSGMAMYLQGAVQAYKGSIPDFEARQG